MLYTYRPKHDTRIPRLGIAGPGVYEVEEADAAELNARITGADGPALVPFADEPMPEGSEPVATAKRGRKARGEA